jgi:hypothetical protein
MQAPDGAQDAGNLLPGRDDAPETGSASSWFGCTLPERTDE